MIEYKEEEVTEELYNECLHLFNKHKEEISLFNEELNVKIEDYIKVYRLKMFRLYSAREDGIIIGYAAYFITKHPHYQTLIAEQDILYVDPKNRKGSIGLRLIKFSEASLRNLGVVRVIQRSKVHKNIGTLFSRLGYKPIETVYSKEL